MSTVIPASAMGSETAARGSFFFWLSVLLLAFLLLGFAPTLYLRAFTDPEPIPAYLHVHGVVLTSWYVWFVVQTSMVRTGRVAQHRRLGVIGAVIGAAVVVAAPMATLASSADCAPPGPALARVSRWPVFGGEDGPFIPVVFLGLVLAVVAPSEFGLAVVRLME